MPSIQTTKNYSRFITHEINRPIGNTTKLEASMQKHGWIDAYPVHVVKNGSTKLKILAGHHRFQVAKSLGIPVKFVVCNPSAEIHELEAATRLWSLQDYLVSYARAGKKEYQEVQDYCDKTGFAVYTAVALLGGHTVESGRLSQSFRAGNYKIKDRSHAGLVYRLSAVCRNRGFKKATSRSFVHALSRISRVPEFDEQRFHKKFRKYAYKLEHRSTTDEYLSIIEDVYNWQTSDKVDLAIMAKKAHAARNPSTKKNA